jgi:hypothetical protein
VKFIAESRLSRRKFASFEVLPADGIVPLSCSEICYVLYLVTGVGRPYSVVLTRLVSITVAN